MMSLSSLPHFWRHRLGLALMLPTALVSALVVTPLSTEAQTPATGGTLTVRANTQEANSKTGVLTARGNVQIYYPARQLQATSAQAQYFTRERRIVLSGDVYVLQRGNSIRGDSVTYLIDEGRFVATPRANTQVESIYIVSDPNPTQSPAPATPPLKPAQ